MAPAQSAHASPQQSRPQSPQLSQASHASRASQSSIQTRQSQSAPQSPVRPPPADNDESTALLPIARDLAVAFKLAVFTEWRRFIRCFFQVPLGIVAIMASCFGINRLLNMGGVSFPASVACLVILFVGLVLCDLVLGRRPTERIVRAINIPGGWSLRWMNLFFVQSFVMLPLSPHISIVEIVKLILVFVIGFLLMMVVSVYMTRWIQAWTSPPRKAMLPSSEHATSDSESEELTPLRTSAFFSSDDYDDKDMPPAPPRSRVAAYITVRGQNLDDPLSSFSDVPAPHMHFYSSSSSYATPRHYYRPGGGTRTPTPPPRESPTPPPVARARRADRWAEWASAHIDTCFYLFVMLAVGVPVYFGAGYAMPLHLCINILAFFGAMALPASWRQILHPVIVSAFSSLLVIWLLGRVRGDSLAATLALYKPGYTYIKLWANAAAGAHDRVRMLPGAGDVLSSFLDASIVSLALPMFQYRHELKTHCAAIVVPNVVLSIVSLFAYPAVCHAIGISATRSLAFTSRSLTLALATPAVTNLGGDLNTIAAITILSGVFGVLIGQRILRLLRIPEDDYVTRGVAIGANASALGTALLLRVDPPAAAISSLAMSLFGTITVAFSSIPPIVHVIRATVGL